KGRGVLVNIEPVAKVGGSNGQSAGQQGSRRGRGRGSDDAARESAASQAARDAVQNIAKATVLVADKDKPAEPVSADEPAEVSVPEQAESVEAPAHADEPVHVEPVEPVEDEAPSAEPEIDHGGVPVSRRRRRSASRPAGP